MWDLCVHDDINNSTTYTRPLALIKHLVLPSVHQPLNLCMQGKLQNIIAKIISKYFFCGSH